MRIPILILLAALMALPAASQESAPPPDKSAKAAMGSSVAFPALGQLYTGGRVRTVSVFLLEGWCLSNILRETSQEDLYRRHAARLDGEDTWKGWTGEECLAFAESHRERKRDFIWYLAPVLIYSVVDAFVAAHLYNFETEDLRPRAALMPIYREDGAAGLAFRVSF